MLSDNYKPKDFALDVVDRASVIQEFDSDKVEKIEA